MEEQWILYTKKADFGALATRFQIDPVIARVIRNRDVATEEEYAAYLGETSALHDPHLFKDMDRGVALIKEAIDGGKKIRIICDYDVDGIMSNFILFEGLKAVGANVDYRIPDRVVDGYGMNEEMVREAHDAGVEVLITCDNGIAALLPIAYAKNLGMTVVVTDHHEVPFEYSDEGDKEYQISTADAVIDPKQEDCPYPYKQICGAMVVYKFLQVLYPLCGKEAEEVNRFVEMVAMATICDVMPLLDENRTMVKWGLQELNRTWNYGLRALIRSKELELGQVQSYHVGFVLGPCINASGRLESAMLAMDLLLEQNYDHALELASRIVALNEERKELTEKAVASAIEQVNTTTLATDRVLIIYLADTHESIAGIVAGRVKEHFYRPTIILTDSEDGMLKGSGRSIEAYNIHEALTECQDLLVKFGGHPMAAGLSLKAINLDVFRHQMNILCDLTEEEMRQKVYIDVEMPFGYVSFPLISQLSLLEPCGNGNSKAHFAQRNVRVKSARVMGKNQNVLKLRLEGEDGATLDGIYFRPQDFLDRIREWYGEEQCDMMLRGWLNNVRIDVVYYPQINEFNGTRSMQIKLEYYKKSAEPV